MAPSRSSRVSYRRRVKGSTCRGLKFNECQERPTCMRTRPTRKPYCRKKINTRRKR